LNNQSVLGKGEPEKIFCDIIIVKEKRNSDRKSIGI